MPIEAAEVLDADTAPLGQQQDTAEQVRPDLHTVNTCNDHAANVLAGSPTTSPSGRYDAECGGELASAIGLALVEIETYSLPVTIISHIIRSLRSSILILIDAASHPDCRATFGFQSCALGVLG
jgi:hypothetical protein